MLLSAGGPRLLAYSITPGGAIGEDGRELAQNGASLVNDWLRLGAVWAAKAQELPLGTEISRGLVRDWPPPPV